jgi:SAM-dependent methyltransferase
MRKARAVSTRPSTALLGDTAARDYSSKLSRFNAFAAPELRQAIEDLDLRPGMRVLDGGCGTGEALRWLSERVQPDGEVIGIDLAAAHVAAARSLAPPQTLVLQANLLRAPLAPGTFDRVWCVNTINHLRDPDEGIKSLKSLLKPGGLIALGQSSLVPDMYFAWDSRLERVTNDAVRSYYRDRYQISERQLTAVRAIFGLLRRARLRDVTARTLLIERVSPVSAADEAYLAGTIFRDTWGERLRAYLEPDDFAELARLCDPDHPDFALRRPDFHFVQSFTVVTGRA